MSVSKDSPHQEEDTVVTVERLSFGGEGVGRLADGRVVFVRGGLPGDECRVRLTEDKKRFARAEVTELVAPSPDRIDAACQASHRCGGCQLWALPAEAAWALKRDAAIDALKRAGRLDLSDVALHEVQAPEDRRYRRRVRFQVDLQGHTGFYEAGSHTLLPLSDCLVLHPALVSARNALEGHLGGLGGGSLHLELDADTGTAVALLDVQEGQRALKRLTPLLTPPHAALRGLRVLHAPFDEPHADLPPSTPPSTPDTSAKAAASSPRSSRRDGRRSGERRRPHKGSGRHRRRSRQVTRQTPRVATDLGVVGFTQVADALTRRLTVGGFTQANDAVNEQLIAQVAEALAISAGARVLELYCGAGNFSLGLLRDGAHVHGLELSQDAVDAARRNAAALLKSDAAQRARFDVADLNLGLPSPLSAPDLWDAVLLDPPRAGARALGDDLRRLAAPRVVYVSCDPPSLGRDLQALTAPGGYRLRSLTTFDMFPRTYHVEVMAVLERATPTKG